MGTNPDVLNQKDLWERGLVEELTWWKHWLLTEEGVKYTNEILNPQMPLQEHLIVARLPEIASESISILDVGAGPITGLGYTYPGKDIKISAVDALAHDYTELLTGLGISPPVRTVFCHGEGLLERFERESFNFAYACNSLDHSYDPLLIIKNMLALVKQNGSVVLRHYRNEGQTGNYHGLHQWNFDIEGGDFLLWNKATRHNMTQIFSRDAQVECYKEKSLAFGVFDYSDWVVFILKKLQ